MSAEIVGLGEILWDLLPAGRQLGGAPFNFTYHCHQLGHPAIMVSRVGNDELGRDIRVRVQAAGLSDEFVQTDCTHPTGTVSVQVDAAGQPAYTIHADAAWDFLEWNDRLGELVGQARAICFGTLAQRHAVSRATLRRLLEHAADDAIVVYDVNLRQHYYDSAVVEASLHASIWVKLNDEELIVLRGLLGLAGGGPAELLAELRRRYRLEMACLTRGAAGSLIQSESEEVDVPGAAVQVVDTIGAGDAFTAGLLCGRLEGLDLARAARFANLLAARVAASAGGTPSLDAAVLRAQTLGQA